MNKLDNAIDRANTAEGKCIKLMRDNDALLRVLEDFVAAVNYHDIHDAPGFVPAMFGVREAARAAIRAAKGESA